MSTAETKSCKIEGCKRAYRAKGYCTVHYNKWRRGEIEGEVGRYKSCSEEGCHKPMYRKGKCEQHYGAWSASKKPEVPVAEAPKEEAVPAAAEAAPVEEKKEEAAPAAAEAAPAEEKKAEAAE